MSRRDTVYVLLQTHHDDSGRGETHIAGVYETREDAKQAKTLRFEGGIRVQDLEIEEHPVEST